MAKTVVVFGDNNYYLLVVPASRHLDLREAQAALGLKHVRLATEIVVCPIVREPDGLALSSRNVYLTPAERAQALVLSHAIQQAEALVSSGERRASALIEVASQVFATEPAVRIDYIAVVDWATLEPVEIAAPGTLFAVAAWVGATRLIDNATLT